jgi:hypothetical protein
MIPAMWALVFVAVVVAVCMVGDVVRGLRDDR